MHQKIVVLQTTAVPFQAPKMFSSKCFTADGTHNYTTSHLKQIPALLANGEPGLRDRHSGHEYKCQHPVNSHSLPYGHFVTGIYVVEANGTAGQYWSVKVNGNASGCGISTTILGPSDDLGLLLEEPVEKDTGATDQLEIVDGEDSINSPNGAVTNENEETANHIEEDEGADTGGRKDISEAESEDEED